jgi:hypothetical protein
MPIATKNGQLVVANFKDDNCRHIVHTNTGCYLVITRPEPARGFPGPKGINFSWVDSPNDATMFDKPAAAKVSACYITLTNDWDVAYEPV